MKRWLVELAESLVGATWWGATWAVGIAMGAIFTLAPLLLANMTVEIVDVPATVALAVGVAGAYALGLSPWDADERESLPLVIGGTAVSVVTFDLVRGSADLPTLLVALGLAVAGWPLRRLATRREG